MLNNFLILETTAVGGEIDSKAPKSPAKAAPYAPAESTITSTSNEQTTLIPNEEEAFALEPLEATVFHGKLLICNWLYSTPI